MDGGTKRLVATVGLPKALELAMTGREGDATEAGRIGLVNEVVAPARHVDRALEIAEQLAFRVKPAAHLRAASGPLDRPVQMAKSLSPLPLGNLWYCSDL